MHADIEDLIDDLFDINSDYLVLKGKIEELLCNYHCISLLYGIDSAKLAKLIHFEISIIEETIVDDIEKQRFYKTLRALTKSSFVDAGSGG
nr:hypothetical protein [uncultured Cohaesibacter sp.]